MISTIIIGTLYSDNNQTLIVWYETFKTLKIVPGAPPSNISAVATSATTIKVSWKSPPQDRSNGKIVYYKLFFVESDRPDGEADAVKLNTTEFVLDELKRWTEYKIWVLAGTSVGDGPKSYPINVQTHEDGKIFKIL